MNVSSEEVENARFTILENEVKMLVSFAIDTVGAVFAASMIIKKSPPKMKTYSYVILNIVFWSYLLDLLITLFWMPLPMMPAPGLCNTGILRTVDPYFNHLIAFVLFIILLGSVGCAINTAIFYRFLHINPENVKLFKNKIFLFFVGFLHVFSTFPVLMSYYIQPIAAIVHQRQFIQEKYPQFLALYDLIPCGVFAVGKGGIKGPNYFLITALVTILVHIAFGITFAFFVLKHFLTVLTERQNHLQRQIITSLIIQCLLPVLCIVLPFGTLVVETIVNLEFLGGIVNALMTLGGLHSFLHSLVIVMVIKPYRNAIKEYGKKLMSAASDIPLRTVA